MVVLRDPEYPEFPLGDKKQKQLRTELQHLENQYASVKTDAERVALLRKLPKLTYTAL